MLRVRGSDRQPHAKARNSVDGQETPLRGFALNARDLVAAPVLCFNERYEKNAGPELLLRKVGWRHMTPIPAVRSANATTPKGAAAPLHPQPDCQASGAQRSWVRGTAVRRETWYAGAPITVHLQTYRPFGDAPSPKPAPVYGAPSTGCVIST